MQLRFFVEGMTCAVCAGSVEKVVSRVSGVSEAHVNLTAKLLTCECEDTVSADAIAHAVEGAGFSAVLYSEREEKAPPDETQAALWRFFSSLVFLAPLLYLSMGHMLPVAALRAPLEALSPSVCALLQLVLTLPVLAINRGFFLRGGKAVLRGGANMDTLVSLGSASAFVYSLAQTVRLLTGGIDGPAELYFESSAMILTLVTFGKLLESRAQKKTGSALGSLMELSVKSAHVLRGGREIEVLTEAIVIGDLIVLRPGERIPVDGVVVEGQSCVDLSALTGESLPVDIFAGESVYSGAINLIGTVTVRAEKIADESMLSQMIRLVEQAGVSKSPAARLADRIARIFVPTVSVIALLTGALWLLVGESPGFALARAISVLVVSCPCALGLATPVAVTAALGRCAARGVLVRQAASFDALCLCDTVVLDKTGTLTRGTPQVTQVFALCEPFRLLQIAASVEEKSEHPLARAVCAYVDAPRLFVQDFCAEFGKGISATLDGTLVRAGSARFLEEAGVSVSVLDASVERELSEGKSVIYVSQDDTLLGAIAICDVLREESLSAVAALTRQNVRVLMLTGDKRATAEAICRRCGISDCICEVLPQEKESQVRALQEAGAHVLMVGDGINDAAALARADVGVSVGAGTDVAKNASDVILLSNELSALPALMRYAVRVRRVIAQNLFWAFFYNVAAIPIAAGALVPLGITLNPMIAAACMSISSLFVVTNALRLYRGKELL